MDVFGNDFQIKWSNHSGPTPLAAEKDEDRPQSVAKKTYQKGVKFGGQELKARLPPVVLIQDVVSICLPKLALGDGWKLALRIRKNPTETTGGGKKFGFLKDISSLKAHPGLDTF